MTIFDLDIYIEETNNLCDKKHVILHKLIDNCIKELPYTNLSLKIHKPNITILLNDNVIGFYCSRQEIYKPNNELRYRSGVIYINKEYRRLGLAKVILTEYFKTHKPAFALIANNNLDSQKLFTSLGFIKSINYKIHNRISANYWLLD